MREYEILYIISPDLDEAKKDELVKNFDDILTNNGAEISESSDWKKDRFAYEIKNYREGTYHLIYFSTPEDSSAIDEFERLASINDNILRHIVVRREDKE